MLTLRGVVLAALLAATALVAAPALPDPIRTPIAFPTDDGVILRGWWWDGGDDAVVLSHMFGTDQRIWADLAHRLAGAGFAALTYNFRGVGRSGGRLVIARTHRDVEAAIRFARRRGARRVFLVGASMGGTASLVAAGHEPVEGIVVIASGMRFRGLNVLPHLTELRMPKLFIVGSGDHPFAESVRTMYARTRPPKELKVYPTAAHGTYMFRTRHRAAIEGAIVEFLRRSAGGR